MPVAGPTPNWASFFIKGNNVTIEEKVKRIICEVLNQSDEDIKPASELASDLGADSLDIVEICMFLEEEFEVAVPDEVLDTWKTAGNIINYFTQILNNQKQV